MTRELAHAALSMLWGLGAGAWLLAIIRGREEGEEGEPGWVPGLLLALGVVLAGLLWALAAMR